MELNVTLPLPGPGTNIISRHEDFLPGYELAWSVTSYAYNDADRYTGTYHDGTAYSNITAVIGKRILCMKQAMVASGWTVQQSSVAGAVSNSDLWANAPDIERGDGHWIVLLAPDGVSQLVIQKQFIANRMTFYFLWSYGGLFSAGTEPLVRPTASDEVGPGDGAYPTEAFVGLNSWSTPTGAFYGFRGLRGDEATSRIVQVVPISGAGGKVEFFFSLERFVTDIPESIYPRNVCTFAFNTKYEKQFFQKAHAYSNVYYLRITMPDGKLPRTPILRCARYPGYYPTNYTDAFGGKSRMLPVYLQEPNSSGDHQFFGYIPDMYFGNNSGSLFSWYNHRTFGGVWMRFAELCLPVFDTSYSTSLGDTAGAACVIASSSDTIGDTVAPAFAGIAGASVIDDNTVRLTWESGYDDVSMHESLVYEIHYSTSEGAAFAVRGEAVGTITHDVTLLKPGTTYYFRVRCRDEAGNVDSNTVEISATTTGAIDTTKPTASLVSPPAGSAVGPFTTHVIDVEDEALLRRIWFTVEYRDGAGNVIAKELVYDGDGFDPMHFGNSSRVETNTGKSYRYYITRTSGWQSAPRIVVRAIDASGNELELLS
jgi:hypothetical protein